MTLRLITLEQLKQGIELEVDDSQYDDLITSFGEECEAFVEDHCDYNFDVVPGTRTWDAPASPYLYIDAAQTVTSVTVGGVSTTAYRKLPDTLTHNPHYETLLCLSAPPADGGEPVRWAEKGEYKLIVVVGTWGYSSSVPLVVKRALVILVARMMRRHRSHYGNQSGVAIGGGNAGYSTEFTPKAFMDKDVQALLTTVCRKFPRRNLPAWRGGNA